MVQVMSLAAKISLDASAYEKGLKKAEGTMSKFGNGLEKASRTLSAKTIALGTFAGNMLTKGVTTLFKTTSDVVKKATDAYANYEQLTGGVKTLFGTREIKTARDYAKQIGLISEKVDKTGKTITKVNKQIAKTLFGDTTGKTVSKLTPEEVANRAYAQAEKAQQDVMDNASKAYQTAGVSMNHYMETATAFAASMNQATGGNTVKSAELTDLAIRDMADNANKMGTAMESVEYAYKGFAKGNYTMLDNLKLGYGGTKTEMQRLLKDASKLTGEKYKMGNLADITKAIHAIQESQGITGTTEKEARETIQGSKQMLGAAWENVLTALAAPEDLDLSGAIKSLTDSAKTYLNNLFPVVSTVLEGLGNMIEEILPDIMEKLPEMLADFVPKLISAGRKMFKSFGRGLKKIASQIEWPSWEDVKGAISYAWQKVINGFKSLGKLIFGENADGTTKWPTAKEIFAKVKEIWDEVLTKAAELVPIVFGEDSTISEAFTNALHFIQDFGNWVLENWENVKQGIEFIGAAFVGWKIAEIASSLNPIQGVLLAIGAIATLVIANWDTVKTKVSEVVAWLGKQKDAVVKWVEDNLITPFNNFKDKIQEAWNLFKELFVDFAVDTASKFITWINDNLVTPFNNFKDKLQEAWDLFKALFVDWAVDTASGFITWVSDNLVKPIEGFITKINEAIALLGQLFGMNSTGNDEWTGPESSGKPEPQTWYVGPPQDGVETDQQLTKDAQKAEEKQSTLNKTIGETGTIGTNATIRVSDGMNKSTESIVKASESVGTLKDLIEALKSKTITITTILKTIDGAVNGNTEAPKAPPVGRNMVVKELKAKGDWNVGYDHVAMLHRGEMVLTKSQARKYREGNNGNIDLAGLAASIVAAVKEGMAGASVNSYLDGRNVTGRVNRRNTNRDKARRFVTA